MGIALDSAPKTLSLDSETTLDLVPSKALLLEGSTKKSRTARMSVRARRLVKPLMKVRHLAKPLLRYIRFRKHQQRSVPQTIQNTPLIFESGPLTLDMSCEIASDGADYPRQITNNTKNHFWIRSVDDQPITGEHFTSTEPKIQSVLKWKNPVLAPAYRFRGCSSTDGLISALPSSLMIKPGADYKKKPQELDKILAADFGLLYQPEMSRYLAGFRYYVIAPSNKNKTPLGNAFQAWQKLQTPEYKKLVEHCELEIVPHCVPTANGQVLNDPYYDGTYGTQWNLSWIKAEEGWARAGWIVGDPSFKPGENVIVAVIDSGVDLDNPDFESRSAFVGGATFKPGSDFDYEVGEGSVEIDDDPETGGSESDDAHGTCCAGIIGARCDNNQGIAGLAGWCKIMPIAINGYYKSTVAAAINWAAEHDADVISMSFGGDKRNHDYLKGDVVDAAIRHAYFDKKVVLCASSMNQDEPRLYYPASHPNVLACGASARDKDTRSSGEWPVTVGPGSNFGPELGVVAPGTTIGTTASSLRSAASPYTRSFCGTSAAAPQVAGLAALLISAYPDKLRDNPSEVYRIIQGSARSAKAWDREVGYGCIDVLEAFITAEKDYGAPSWQEY